MIASLIIFTVAEVIAEIIQLWLVKNPTGSNLTMYNRTLSSVPQALSTGGAVFLAFGLPYYSNSRIFTAAIVGVIFIVTSFILNFMNVLSSTIEYYPGYYFTIPSGPIANLFSIGTGAVIAAIMSIVLRDMIIQKAGLET